MMLLCGRFVSGCPVVGVAAATAAALLHGRADADLAGGARGARPRHELAGVGVDRRGPRSGEAREAEEEEGGEEPRRESRLTRETPAARRPKLPNSKSVRAHL